MYPNLTLNRYGPWLDINLVEPTGSQTCTVRFEYFLDQGFGADDRYVQESLEVSEAVQQEDVKLCEAVQRGLKSPAYDKGRYDSPKLHCYNIRFPSHFCSGDVFIVFHTLSLLACMSMSRKCKSLAQDAAILHLQMLPSHLVCQ